MRLLAAMLVVGMGLVGCSSPSTEKDPPVIVVADDMGVPNSSVDCGEGRSYCGDGCIDTALDSMNCGDCGVECPEQTVCSQSDCVPVPADCRTGGECPTSYYCEEATGFCAVGCDSNEDCPSGSFCQIEANTCLCQADSQVVCGSQCVEEGPTACGTECQTCPVPQNASAACVEGECQFSCNAGTTLCDGTCATCPTEAGIAATGCDGTSCVATQCEDGYELCNGVCAACPGDDPGASFGCDGTSCVVTDCPAGTRLCDGTCADCPNPTGGTLQCTGSQCTLACNAGSNLCNGSCVPDDDVDQCGSSCTTCPSDPNGDRVCEQGACGLSCDGGFRECSGACSECPSVGVASTRCAGDTCVVASCQADFYPCSLGCCQDPTSGVVTDIGSQLNGLDVAIGADGFPVGVYTGTKDEFFYWDGQQWAFEPLPASSSPVFVSMDLDANGVAHVAYRNFSTVQVEYVNRMSGTFVGATPVVVSGRSGVGGPDIAVDDAGNVHILVKTSYELAHHTSASNWARTEVDPAEPAATVGLVWAAGRLHAIYGDGPPNANGSVYYRWYEEASGWSDRQLVNTGQLTGGLKIGIAAAANGDVWAFWGGSSISAAKGPGTWTEIGQASPSTAIDPSIAMDEAGVPHLFYDYYGIQEIEWTGTAWSAETEHALGDERPRAVYDANGVMHLFYYEGTQLKYLRQ